MNADKHGCIKALKHLYLRSSVDLFLSPCQGDIGELELHTLSSQLTTNTIYLRLLAFISGHNYLHFHLRTLAHLRQVLQ